MIYSIRLSLLSSGSVQTQLQFESKNTHHRWTGASVGATTVPPPPRATPAKGRAPLPRAASWALYLLLGPTRPWRRLPPALASHPPTFPETNSGVALGAIAACALRVFRSARQVGRAVGRRRLSG